MGSFPFWEGQAPYVNLETFGHWLTEFSTFKTSKTRWWFQPFFWKNMSQTWESSIPPKKNLGAKLRNIWKHKHHLENSSFKLKPLFSRISKGHSSCAFFDAPSSTPVLQVSFAAQRKTLAAMVDGWQGGFDGKKRPTPKRPQKVKHFPEVDLYNIGFSPYSKIWILKLDHSPGRRWIY